MVTRISFDDYLKYKSYVKNGCTGAFDKNSVSLSMRKVLEEVSAFPKGVLHPPVFSSGGITWSLKLQRR
jgi:hypothetical protein